MRPTPSAAITRRDGSIVGEVAARVARRDAEHGTGAAPGPAVGVVASRQCAIARKAAVGEIELRAALGVDRAAAVVARSLRSIVGEGAVGEVARAASEPDRAAIRGIGYTASELAVRKFHERGGRKKNCTAISSLALLESRVGALKRAVAIERTTLAVRAVAQLRWFTKRATGDHTCGRRLRVKGSAESQPLVVTDVRKRLYRSVSELATRDTGGWTSSVDSATKCSARLEPSILVPSPCGRNVRIELRSVDVQSPAGANTDCATVRVCNSPLIWTGIRNVRVDPVPQKARPSNIQRTHPLRPDGSAKGAHDEG